MGSAERGPKWGSVMVGTSRARPRAGEAPEGRATPPLSPPHAGTQCPGRGGAKWSGVSEYSPQQTWKGWYGHKKQSALEKSINTKKKARLYTSGCPLGVRSGLDAADEAGADALRPPGEAVLRRGRHGRGALLWLGVSANVGWGREEGRRLSTFFVFVVWVGWVGGQGHHPPLTRGRKHHLPSDKPPKY